MKELKNLIVALVGHPGSGKSTISEILSNTSASINWIRSRDIIVQLSGASTIEEVQSRGLDFFQYGNGLPFVHKILDLVEDEKINIFDSLRPVAHWTLLREKFPGNLLLAGVQIDKNKRLERLIARDGQKIALKRINHDVEQEIPVLMLSAHFFVNSNKPPYLVCHKFVDNIIDLLPTLEGDISSIYEILLTIQNQLKEAQENAN